jgi:hypothetical protein
VFGKGEREGLLGVVGCWNGKVDFGRGFCAKQQTGPKEEELSPKGSTQDEQRRRLGIFAAQHSTTRK